MTKFMILLFTLLMATPSWAAFRAYNGTTDLKIFDSIKCSTGLTCSRSLGNLVIVSSPTLAAPLSLAGAEAGDAVFTLQADESDDNGDDWAIKSVASSNALSFFNDTSGSQVFKLSLSTAGTLTLADSETLANASDVVTLAADDAAANLTLTGFEASNSLVVLKADESDDNGDDWAMTSVASDNTLTISNDTSGSQVAKITVAASDGDLTLTGGITGDGGDTLSGFLRKQVATTTTTITAAQCGSTFISDSADVMTLPEASTVLGCRLSFVCGTTDDLDINPNDGTDQILPVNSVAGGTGAAITPAAGDAIRCTDIGSSLMIEATGANAWAAVGVGNGAWTDVN